MLGVECECSSILSLQRAFLGKERKASHLRFFANVLRRKVNHRGKIRPAGTLQYHAQTTQNFKFGQDIRRLPACSLIPVTNCFLAGKSLDSQGPCSRPQLILNKETHLHKNANQPHMLTRGGKQETLLPESVLASRVGWRWKRNAQGLAKSA